MVKSFSEILEKAFYMYKYIISEHASFEITEIAKYYFKIDKKLSEKFLYEIETAIISITKNPLLYRVRYSEIRRFNMSSFPFSAFYIIENTKVIILRVLHQHRDSVYWP